MLIHATAITNLTDARYFAAKEVDYIGFCLEEHSKTYLDPAYMQAIREWVQGPVLTGWFEQSSLEEIAEAARFYHLGAVVVHHELLQDSDTSPIAEIEWHLFLPYHLAETAANLAFSHPPESIILDMRSTPDANDVMIDGGALSEICRRRKMILFFDALSYEQLVKIQASAAFAGICLSGGEEEKVGVKSFDMLEDLFDALEERRLNS